MNIHELGVSLSLSQIGLSGGPAFLKCFGFKEDVMVFTNLDVVFQVTEIIVTAPELLSS